MQRYLRNLLYTFRVVAYHPLTRQQPMMALLRWLRWQIGSRLVPGPVAIPFVNKTRLLVSPSMHGATLNIYVGLSEFSEMGFLLHFLRPTDLFVDAGANVGMYTILASGVVGCGTVAFEPGPIAFDRLQANVALNCLSGLVDCHAQALSNERRSIKFTWQLDTLNHVVSDNADNVHQHELAQIETTTLDAVLVDRQPTLMKIDVEGYEAFVLAGSTHTLSDPSLQALIVEINENCKRYGIAPRTTFDTIERYGFRPCQYDPLKRELIELTPGTRQESGEDNTIWVRDRQSAEKRLKDAPPFRVLGMEV